MKDKKMLSIGIIAIIIIIAVATAIILNKDKNKENDINNNNIDTEIDQNLFFEEELDPEEIEAINRQRTQEIRRLRK